MYAILLWILPFYFSGEFPLEAFGTSEDCFENVEVGELDDGNVGTASDHGRAVEIFVGGFGEHSVG